MTSRQRILIVAENYMQQQILCNEMSEQRHVFSLMKSDGLPVFNKMYCLNDNSGVEIVCSFLTSSGFYTYLKNELQKLWRLHQLEDYANCTKIIPFGIVYGENNPGYKKCYLLNSVTMIMDKESKKLDLSSKKLDLSSYDLIDAFSPQFEANTVTDAIRICHDKTNDYNRNVIDNVSAAIIQYQDEMPVPKIPVYPAVKAFVPLINNSLERDAYKRNLGEAAVLMCKYLPLVADD